MNKKLVIAVISTSILAIVGILVYLFLPISCPKGVDIQKDKSESMDTILVVDGSLSMEDKTNAGEGEEMTKYEAATKASLEIISMIEREKKAQLLKNKIGYVEFSGSLNKSIKLNENFDEVKKYLTSGYGGLGFGTNMGSGIEQALKFFEQSDSKNKTMIVLSDGRSNTGLTNDEVLSKQVSKAKEKGIKMYTIGFDVSENEKTATSEGVDSIFLYKIAKNTDGKYYYAQKLLDLVYAFSDLYHQATGNVVASIKGEIKNGEFKAAKITVPCDCGDLRVTVNSSSKSKIKLNLINSSSNLIKSNSGRFNLKDEDGFVNATFRNPLAGEWQIELKGEDIKGDKGDFYLSASVTNKKSDSNSLSDWISDRLWYLLTIVGLSILGISTFAYYKSNK